MLRMKKQGTVVKWDDARGFGFISSGAKGDLFFHVRDFRGMNTLQPREGLLVAFEEKLGDKGLRAVAVQPASEASVASRSDRGSPSLPPAARSRKRQEAASAGSGAALALPLMIAYGTATVWAVWTRQMPWWVLPALFVLNVLTFYAYMLDKYAAGRGAWRISENALHLWSLAGGWPGAWFAQQLLRHKSRKQEFRVTYWVTVVLHCAALGVWLYPAAITSFTTPAVTANLVTPSGSISNTPRPLV
jgi:uncharacterized membrane protein YsdA (DUF1294 family)/cold shock CspA family protein